MFSKYYIYNTDIVRTLYFASVVQDPFLLSDLIHAREP